MAVIPSNTPDKLAAMGRAACRFGSEVAKYVCYGYNFTEGVRSVVGPAGSSKHR